MAQRPIAAKVDIVAKVDVIVKFDAIVKVMTPAVHLHTAALHPSARPSRGPHAPQPAPTSCSGVGCSFSYTSGAPPLPLPPLPLPLTALPAWLGAVPAVPVAVAAALSARICAASSSFCTSRSAASASFLHHTAHSALFNPMTS